MSELTNLFGMAPATMAALFAEWGEPSFRVKQVMQWIYHHRVIEFDHMTNLSKGLRERLATHCVVAPPTDFVKHHSRDGSIKYVFRMAGEATVEAVYMPMEKGVTLCLSSQIGCAQACSFCLTAQMGFIRNLTTAEIVGQAYTIQNDMGFEGPFNVVMMGMGEPLLNIANLETALALFTDDLGLALSPRRITVSTSGHVRNLLRLGQLPKLPRIAVSLNATTDEQRNELMPVNLKWNIAELIDACKRIPLPPRERLTFEYVLIAGFNDSLADAKRLVRLLASVRCKVNLIPFNETEGLDYRQSDLATIETFRQILNRSKILNTVRWSKGRDIGAACGQLATPVGQQGANLRRASAS